MFVACTDRGSHPEDVFGVLVWSRGMDGAQWVSGAGAPRRRHPAGVGEAIRKRDRGTGRRSRIHRLGGPGADGGGSWQFGPCRICTRDVRMKGENVELLRPLAAAELAADGAYTLDVSLLPA